jgi:hypothetical protein
MEMGLDLFAKQGQWWKFRLLGNLGILLMVVLIPVLIFALGCIM